jgi:hypothetical protein
MIIVIIIIIIIIIVIIIIISSINVFLLQFLPSISLWFFL